MWGFIPPETKNWEQNYCNKKSEDFTEVDGLRDTPLNPINNLPTTKCVSAVHYADLGDVQQGKPLPGKASLWVKNVFSSTGRKICSLVYTRFPKRSTLLVQELGPKLGHNSWNESVPVSGILV